MSGKNTAVFGIYRDRMHVESSIDILLDQGFRAADISVLLPNNVGTKDFAHEKHTKAPEGAATGAGTGAVIGARWAYSPASARWPSRESARSLRRDRSWELSPASARAAWSAD